VRWPDNGVLVVPQRKPTIFFLCAKMLPALTPS
jgi:hypothetical protein